jgi:hypothetical protein
VLSSASHASIEMRGLAASIDVHSVGWKTEIDGVEMIVTTADDELTSHPF